MPLFKDWISGRTAEAALVDDDEFYVRDDSGDADKRITYAGLKTAMGDTFGPHLSVAPTSGRYIGVPYIGVRADGVAGTLNRLELSAIPLPVAVSVDRLAINVATGEASATPRLGIYASDADGVPDALVVDGGQVDASSSGVKEATISPTTIGPGLVWFAVAYQGASSTLRISHSNLDAGVIKTSRSNGGEAIYYSTSCWHPATVVSGALPDPVDVSTDSATGRYAVLGAVRAA